MECDFCKSNELRERIVRENDLAYIVLTYTPIVPGHLLIIPKRHVQYYEDLTEEEKRAIEILREWSKGALKKNLKAEGFNYAWNEEEIGGQSVPHFHLHVVPRKDGDAGIYTYEPREFLYRPGTRAQTPTDELAEIANQLRES